MQHARRNHRRRGAVPDVVAGGAVRIEVAQVIHVAARHDDLARRVGLIERGVRAREPLGRLHVPGLERRMRRLDAAVDDGDLHSLACAVLSSGQLPGFPDLVQGQGGVHRHPVFPGRPHPLHSRNGSQRRRLIVIDLHDQRVCRQADSAEHAGAARLCMQAAPFLLAVNGRREFRPSPLRPGPACAPGLPGLFRRAPQGGRPLQLDNVQARRRQRRPCHCQQERKENNGSCAKSAPIHRVRLRITDINADSPSLCLVSSETGVRGI